MNNANIYKEFKLYNDLLYLLMRVGLSSVDHINDQILYEKLVPIRNK